VIFGDDKARRRLRRGRCGAQKGAAEFQPRQPLSIRRKRSFNDGFRSCLATVSSYAARPLKLVYTLLLISRSCWSNVWSAARGWFQSPSYGIVALTALLTVFSIRQPGREAQSPLSRNDRVFFASITRAPRVHHHGDLHDGATACARVTVAKKTAVVSRQRRLGLATGWRMEKNREQRRERDDAVRRETENQPRAADQTFDQQDRGDQQQRVTSFKGRAAYEETVARQLRNPVIEAALAPD